MGYRYLKLTINLKTFMNVKSGERKKTWFLFCIYSYTNAVLSLLAPPPSPSSPSTDINGIMSTLVRASEIWHSRCKILHGGDGTEFCPITVRIYFQKDVSNAVTAVPDESKTLLESSVTFLPIVDAKES
uniref:Uncharacterized protein n=1 Tax=Glossina pallidipes TaxID=7398 RepID=A0A1A9ZIT9_GLOPL